MHVVFKRLLLLISAVYKLDKEDKWENMPLSGASYKWASQSCYEIDSHFGYVTALIS